MLKGLHGRAQALLLMTTQLLRPVILQKRGPALNYVKHFKAHGQLPAEEKI